MRSRPVLALLLGAALSVGLGVPPAAAHDREPPWVALRAEGGRQDPQGVWMQWATRQGRDCVVLEGDGPRRYPPGLSVPPGSNQATITFATRVRPSELEIVARSIDPTLVQAQPGEALPFRLQPTRRKGRIVAWRALIEPMVLPDAYLDVVVGWRNAPPCEGASRMLLLFHLGVSPASPLAMATIRA